MWTVDFLLKTTGWLETSRLVASARFLFTASLVVASLSLGMHSTGVAAPPAAGKKAPAGAAKSHCAAGQVAPPEAPGKCCWPGQIWSASGGQCVGVPRCPDGTALRQGTCVVHRVDAVKRADIRALLQLLGSARLGVRSAHQLIQTYQRALPHVPASFWSQLTGEVREDTLIDLLVPIYDRHLTHDDVKAMLVFYRSPAGQRVLAAMPKIQREAQQAGQRWGVAVEGRINAKLRARQSDEAEEAQKKTGRDAGVSAPDGK